MFLAQALKRCFTKAKISTSPFHGHAISKRFTTSSSPSPLLMLPASEAAASAATAASSSYNGNPSNIFKIRKSCFYNVQTHRFLTKEEVKDAAEVGEQQARTPEPTTLHGSSNGQLVYFDSMQNFYQPRILNAFSIEYFKLPLIEKLPDGLTSYKFRQMGDGSFEMRGVVRENDGSCVGFTTSMEDYKAGEVVVSRNGVVMALDYSHTKLSYHRLGEGDKWTILEKSSKDLRFRGLLSGEDDHRFYCIGSVGPDRDFEVQSWDFHDPSNPKKESYVVAYGEIEGGSYTPYDNTLEEYIAADMYFAQLSGEIHIIIRDFAWHVTEDGRILTCESDKSCKYPYKTVACYVLKLDPVKKKLVHVQSLGDRALFLGLNDPFVLSASDFPGLEPDSIYFSDTLYKMQYEHPHPDFDENKYPFQGHDCGIFSLRDRTFTQCYQTNSKKIWPPPVWIAPH